MAARPGRISGHGPRSRLSDRFSVRVGLDESQINPQTVLFFEVDGGGWNRSGGAELLLRLPRSGGLYVIGFADGSVQQIPRGRIRSLRWNP